MTARRDNPYLNRERWSPCTLRTVAYGFHVAGVAEGEKTVRYWDPDNAYRTLKAALAHVTPALPCVHRVTPVDPATARRTGTPVWFVSVRKLEGARDAVDYGQPP